MIRYFSVVANQSEHPNQPSASEPISPAVGVVDSDPQLGHYEAYSGFSKTLRAWLVAYGIGVPGLIFANERLTSAIAESGSQKIIVAMFLGGVSAQVLATLLYKTTEWYCYSAECDKAFEDSWRYSVSRWIHDQYWLEFSFDLASVTLFVLATYKALVAIASMSGGSVRWWL
jgi:hypothetical protein